VGNDQQNEVAELSWIFGGNEPDLEPPTVEIVEPEDGLVLEQGSDARLRALVDDNYGGYGWRFIIEHDGEVVYDQVDYAKDVDDQYRPALNFTKLEPGTYVFTVEAEDHADHLTSDSVTVVVEDDAASGDSESGGGSEGTGTSGASGDADTSTGVGASTGAVDDATNGEDGSGSSDSGAGADGGGVDPGGCACRAQGGAQPRAPAALLLLGLAGAIRRRSK
jgi:MYXO-CTERM domain-containing protein